MKDLLDSILEFFGYSVCHQLEERTYYSFGKPMCFCARCLGIYLSFFMALSYFFGYKVWYLKQRSFGVVSRGMYFFALFLVVLMPLDVFFQWSGYYFSLTTRFISGATFGVGMTLFIVTLLVDVTRKKAKYRLFTWKEYLALFGVVGLVVGFGLFSVSNSFGFLGGLLDDYVLYLYSIFAVLGLGMVAIVVNALVLKSVLKKDGMLKFAILLTLFEGVGLILLRIYLKI